MLRWKREAPGMYHVYDDRDWLGTVEKVGQRWNAQHGLVPLVGEYETRIDATNAIFEARSNAQDVDHAAEKTASYRVKDANPERLIAKRDIYRYGQVAIAQGDVVRRYTFSNAGFRGIEVDVIRADGDMVFGVSAGAFGVVPS